MTPTTLTGEPRKFLESVIEWAKRSNDVLALALVGSHARDAAREDSDIDLVFIVEDPAQYLNNLEWLNRFGTPVKIENEDWGALHAVRAFYPGAVEIEFGICSEEWARIDPVDPGSRQVVRDGMKILFDPDEILDTLERAAF